MTRINISSGSPFEEPIGFSRAVKIGKIIAVSGTAAIKPDGSTFALDELYYSNDSGATWTHLDTSPDTSFL